MQVSSHGFHHHGLAQPRLSESAQAMRRELAEAGASRGERLVARLDGNGDGTLGLDELQGTKLGRRMNVDRFARLDANGDGALDAAELDSEPRPGRRRGQVDHPSWPGVMENVVRANYANFLAERVSAEDDGAGDVAAQVIDRLDGDGSGALNSEEVAGTRLAGLIGDGFYGIDADRNGALDRDELTGFLTDHLTGAAEPGPARDIPVVPDDTDAAFAAADGRATGAGDEPLDADDAVAGVQSFAAAADAADAGAATDAAGRAERIASAFETALEILRSGSGAADPFEVVQALYGDVQTILNA